MPRRASRKRSPTTSAPPPDFDSGHIHYTSSPSNSPPPSPTAKRSKTIPPLTSDPDLSLNAKSDASDVELDISFFDPTPSDISPLTTLLLPLSLAIPALSSSRVASTLCAQTRVGTVVKVGEDVVGGITALNFRQHVDVLRALKDKLTAAGGRIADLVKKCVNGEGRWERERMAVVLCERVVNLPGQVVAKMYEALVKELEWAVEDEPTQELRDSFRLGWLCYVVQGYVGEENTVLVKKVEDEVWLENAVERVEWEGEAERGGLKRKWIVVLVPASKFPKMQSRMVEVLGGLEADEEEEELKQ